MGVAQIDIEKIIENVSVLRQTLQAGSNNNITNNVNNNNTNSNLHLNHNSNAYKPNYLSVTTANDHQSIDTNTVNNNNNNCKIETMMPNNTNTKPTRRTVS